MPYPIGALARATSLVALVLAATTCSSAEPAAKPCVVIDSQNGVPLLGADCDPRVPSQCGYPFPSNVYLTDGAKTATGKRVAFGATTLSARVGGPSIDAALFNGSDGFSPGQPVITHLPGASITGLPTQDTIDISLTDASPTVLLDADTGERIPHFAELDKSLESEADEDRALMIRPVVRLKDAPRYIVAIRRVVDTNGRAILPSPTFQALRDGSSGCDISVARRRDLYADIFSRLEKAGVPKDDLQIAWDYSTASRANNTKWLLHMRDDALAVVGADGPEYSIDSVEENPNPHIRRRILAKMKVPIYLDKPGPGGVLVFGDDGMPKQTGTAEYGVLIHIPNAATKGVPAGLIQNGHGLFGGKGEGQDGYLAEFADGWNYVAFSVDLIGMASEDVPTITDSIVGDLTALPVPSAGSTREL